MSLLHSSKVSLTESPQRVQLPFTALRFWKPPWAGGGLSPFFPSVGLESLQPPSLPLAAAAQQQRSCVLGGLGGGRSSRAPDPNRKEGNRGPPQQAALGELVRAQGERELGISKKDCKIIKHRSCSSSKHTRSAVLSSAWSLFIQSRPRLTLAWC